MGDFALAYTVDELWSELQQTDVWARMSPSERQATASRFAARVATQARYGGSPEYARSFLREQVDPLANARSDAQQDANPGILDRVGAADPSWSGWLGRGSMETGRNIAGVARRLNEGIQDVALQTTTGMLASTAGRLAGGGSLWDSSAQIPTSSDVWQGLRQFGSDVASAPGDVAGDVLAGRELEMASGLGAMAATALDPASLVLGGALGAGVGAAAGAVGSRVGRAVATRVAANAPARVSGAVGQLPALNLAAAQQAGQAAAAPVRGAFQAGGVLAGGAAGSLPDIAAPGLEQGRLPTAAEAMAGAGIGGLSGLMGGAAAVRMGQNRIGQIGQSGTMDAMAARHQGLVENIQAAQAARQNPAIGPVMADMANQRAARTAAADLDFAQANAMARLSSVMPDAAPQRPMPAPTQGPMPAAQAPQTPAVRPGDSVQVPQPVQVWPKAPVTMAEQQAAQVAQARAEAAAMAARIEARRAAGSQQRAALEAGQEALAGTDMVDVLPGSRPPQRRAPEAPYTPPMPDQGPAPRGARAKAVADAQAALRASVQRQVQQPEAPSAFSGKTTAAPPVPVAPESRAPLGAAQAEAGVAQIHGVDMPIVRERARYQDLEVDPETFQFRVGAQHGSGVVGDRLAGIKKWDPAAAEANPGTIFEAADGRRFVVNGHHRASLAKRLVSEGAGDAPDAPFIVLRESDGWTREAARAFGAKQNLQQGTGTAIDVAKLIRDGGLNQADDASIPKGTEYKMGREIAELSPGAFGRVYSGEVSPEHARAIARHVHGDAQQEAVARMMVKRPPQSMREAEHMAKLAEASGYKQSNQLTIFGQMEIDPIIEHGAAVISEAERLISSDKGIFKKLVSDKEKVKGAGNKLKEKANMDRLVASEFALGIMDELVKSKGPVRDALRALSASVASGKMSKAKAGRALAAIVAEQSQKLQSAGYDKAGAINVIRDELGIKDSLSVKLPGELRSVLNEATEKLEAAIEKVKDSPIAEQTAKIMEEGAKADGVPQAVVESPWNEQNAWLASQFVDDPADAIPAIKANQSGLESSLFGELIEPVSNSGPTNPTHAIGEDGRLLSNEELDALLGSLPKYTAEQARSVGKGAADQAMPEPAMSELVMPEPVMPEQPMSEAARARKAERDAEVARKEEIKKNHEAQIEELRSIKYSEADIEKMVNAKVAIAERIARQLRRSDTWLQDEKSKAYSEGDKLHDKISDGFVSGRDIEDSGLFNELWSPQSLLREFDKLMEKSGLGDALGGSMASGLNPKAIVPAAKLIVALGLRGGAAVGRAVSDLVSRLHERLRPEATAGLLAVVSRLVRDELGEASPAVLAGEARKAMSAARNAPGWATSTAESVVGSVKKVADSVGGAAWWAAEHAARQTWSKGRPLWTMLRGIESLTRKHGAESIRTLAKAIDWMIGQITSRTASAVESTGLLGRAPGLSRISETEYPILAIMNKAAELYDFSRKYKGKGLERVDDVLGFIIPNYYTSDELARAKQIAKVKNSQSYNSLKAILSELGKMDAEDRRAIGRAIDEKDPSVAAEFGGDRLVEMLGKITSAVQDISQLRADLGLIDSSNLSRYKDGFYLPRLSEKALEAFVNKAQRSAYATNRPAAKDRIKKGFARGKYAEMSMDEYEKQLAAGVQWEVKARLGKFDSDAVDAAKSRLAEAQAERRRMSAKSQDESYKVGQKVGTPKRDAAWHKRKAELDLEIQKLKKEIADQTKVKVWRDWDSTEMGVIGRDEKREPIPKGKVDPEWRAQNAAKPKILYEHDAGARLASFIIETDHKTLDAMIMDSVAKSSHSMDPDVSMPIRDIGSWTYYPRRSDSKEKLGELSEIGFNVMPIKEHLFDEYGPLAGKILDEQAAKWLRNENQVGKIVKNPFSRAIDSILMTGLWKRMHTVYSQFYYINQIMVNANTLSVADGNIFDIPKAANYLINDEIPEDFRPVMDELRSQGVIESGSIADSIGMRKSDLIDAYILNEAGNPPGVLRWIQEGENAVAEKLFGAAQVIDDMARVALAIEMHRKGVPPEKIAAEVDEQFYNPVQSTSPMLEGLGQILPFIKVMPYSAHFLAKNLKERPHVFGYNLAMATIGYALSAAAFGAGEELILESSEVIPRYMRESVLAGTLLSGAFLPFEDSYGQKLMINTASANPFGSFEGASNTGFPYFPRSLMPGGTLGAGAEALFNMNLQTGREITPKYADSMQRASDSMAHIAKGLMPMAAINSARGVIDAASGRQDFAGRQIDLPTSLSRMAGLKIEPYDPEREADRRNREFSRKQADLSSDIRRAENMAVQSGGDPEAAAMSKRQQLEEIMSAQVKFSELTAPAIQAEQQRRSSR